MTDLVVALGLLEQYNIHYNKIILYKSDGSNEVAGTAIWLNVGHIEFDTNGKLTNIVNY